MNKLQLQYLRSRKIFREAKRPYDIRDVLDSFKFHYGDLAKKVKRTQIRCNLFYLVSNHFYISKEINRDSILYFTYTYIAHHHDDILLLKVGDNNSFFESIQGISNI